MGTIRNEEEYSCFNDCKQSGCPKHKMELEIQTTSDIMTVTIDGEDWFSADPSEWEALKKMLAACDYNLFDLTIPQDQPHY